jgi:hypothetical protein
MIVYCVSAMDIFTVGKSGFKIKGKSAVAVVDHGEVVLEREKPFKITEPGEYEVSGISVIGVQDETGKIYVIEMDNLRIAYLENINHKLTEKQIEEIGPVDIAICPVLNSDLLTQVDSWVIICETGSDVIPVPRYSVTLDKLPTETTTVVLERKA